jgi:DNA-binding response OmpR family regulator
MQLEPLKKVFITDEIETQALEFPPLDFQRGEFVSIAGKPFQVQELLGWMGALLRREAWYQSRSLGSRQKFGVHWVDFENFCGEGPNGPFHLCVKDCMILKLLMERPGQVVSRTEILEKVWSDETYPTTRTVDNFIVRIRRAMEVDVRRPRYVHSVRSVGYTFDPEGRQRKGGGHRPIPPSGHHEA